MGINSGRSSPEVGQTNIGKNEGTLLFLLDAHIARDFITEEQRTEILCVLREYGVESAFLALNGILSLGDFLRIQKLIDHYSRTGILTPVNASSIMATVITKGIAEAMRMLESIV